MKYSEVLRERYRELTLEKAMRDRGEDPGTTIKTGLKSFDKKAGIDRSILTVIGAPTGEGKSIFAKHLQENAAKMGLKALLMSFEDPPNKQADRTFSTLTSINNASLGDGNFDDNDLARIALELDDATEWADRIDYHFGLQSPEECLEIIEGSDADLVQVDYAQAFPDGNRGLERVIADFAWALNSDAQKRRRATIIYSQLSGRVEERGLRMYESAKRRDDGAVNIEGFRPFGVSDLAWSTALGQRAKGLGFLFRPGRYQRRYGMDVKDNRLELIWPKRNFSAEGRVVVGFDGKTACLFDLNEKEQNTGVPSVG